jgi:molybdenum cofactor cytidylyltransferase
VIVGVLLAAGRSSRFGGAQKLVAMLDGQPIVRRSAELLLQSGVDRVVVVLGSDADAVRAALAGLPVALVRNEAFADGMSGSLREGLLAAESLGSAAGESVEAVLVALGDQPTMDSQVARAVLERFRQRGRDGATARIVAARYDGERGHPVLFARPVFPELLELDGDRGAREVIARDALRVSYVEVAGAPPPDVDSVADLESLGRDE